MILDEAGGIGYGLVTFDEDEISGMDLLRRSGAEPVTVSFGGLGDGVCGIGRTGCSIDVCRKRMCQTGSADSPFWQTFAIGDDGTWASLQLGASADRVSDGEVRLWAWTGTTPDLPAVSLSDISTKVSDRRDQIIWEGSNPTSNGTGSSLWLGLALVGGVSIVAAVVTMRARSQHG